MNVLIEQNSQYGLVVSSRVIAKALGKRHDHVIRDLEKILTSPNVGTLIISSNYKDKKGETRKEYLLTKDGFTLYMFNIQGYQEFKMAYIQKFNEMEKALKQSKELAIKDNDFTTWNILNGSINCLRILSEKINTDLIEMEELLCRIADHKAHLVIYSSYATDKLKELEKEFPMIKTMK